MQGRPSPAFGEARGPKSMENRLYLITFMALVGVLLALGVVTASSVVDVSVKVSTETGYVNWSDGLVAATGMAVAPTNIRTAAQGKLLARRGAIVDAQRQLVETLGSVRVDAETSLVNMMANDVVRTKISGLLHGSFVIPGSETWDGEIYAVEVGLNMRGLLPVVYEERKVKFRVSETTRFTEYTGLVIDARGLRFAPQIMIDIRDEDGRLIYGAAEAYYEPAVSKGLVSYCSALEIARNDPRVGTNPLVVRAERVSGRYQDSLVLSRSDSHRLLNLLSDTDVFADCRVIIVVD